MTPDTESRAAPGRVRLGQGVNLLHAPGPPGPVPWALAAPARPALRELPAELLCPDRGGWQPLAVTLHPDAASLAARLWNCHILPHRFDGPESGVRAGVLMGAEDPHPLRRWLGEILGVPLAAGRSCLLFELRRIDGRADHEATARPARRAFDRTWHLTPEWRKAGTRLRPGERIHDGTRFDARVGAGAAQRYVEAFYEFGTHFVSAVETGDALVQAAVLRPEVVAEVSACWHRLGGGRAVSGEAALHLGRFLRPFYAEEAGPVVSLAGDPVLPASRARGAWSDSVSRSGESLLAALHGGSGRVAELAAATVLGVELTSLSRFLEFYRSLSFERVLRGALVQRWGGRVHLPLRRMPEVERRLAATVLHDEAGSVAAAGRAVLHGDRLDLGTAQADRAAGCYRVASLRGAGREARSGSGTLLAQLLDAEPACHGVPVLRVADDRFDRAGIVCETMAGALVMENESGTRRDAVVDGLRFTAATPEPETGRPRVRVRGDLHTADAAALPDLLPCIRAALGGASVTLSFPASGDTRRADAAAFAEWLAGVLAAGLAQPEGRSLRALALYLSRVEAGVAGGRAEIGAGTWSRVGRHVAEISSAAITADEILRDDDARARARPLSVGLESDTLARLRALRRAVSEAYLAMLAEVSPAHDRAVRAARRVHAEAAAALARAAAMLLEAAAPGSAAEAVLKALAPARGGGEGQSARHGEKGADAALDFLAREAGVQARCAWFDAVEAVCAPAGDAAACEAAEHGLAGLEGGQENARDPVPPARAALRVALLDGVEAKGRAGRALDDVLLAWERFDATRAVLLAARGERCRDRAETWYHAVLAPRAYDPPANEGLVRTPREQIQLERYRLLATLGQVLRRQPAAVHAAPANPLEIGAIGHLLALRVDQAEGPPPGLTRSLFNVPVT